MKTHPNSFTLTTPDLTELREVTRAFFAGRPLPDTPAGAMTDLVKEAKASAKNGQLNEAHFAAALARDLAYQRTGRVGLLRNGLRQAVRRLNGKV